VNAPYNKSTEYRLRSEPKYTRKPGSFYAVPVGITQVELNAITGDGRNYELSTYRADQLWPDREGKANPLADFTCPQQPEIVFILVFGDRRYLVCTEGYSYCRYVCRISEDRDSLTAAAIMALVVRSKFREMTRQDWSGYAGADEGTLICETENLTLLASPSGLISVIGLDADGEAWQVDLHLGRATRVV
jgi:hypothetical protein